MATLEQYDWQNITYNKTLEFARFWTEAISEDPLRRVFRPESAQFAAAQLPPISEYERLIDRVQKYRRMAENDARRFHLAIRSNPRTQLFLLKDPQGRYVAGAQWILPKYLPVAQPSFVYRLKTWLLSLWYRVCNWWHIGRTADSTHINAIRTELELGRRDLSVYDTPQRWDELHSLNLEQLKETTYPMDYTYHLGYLATRRSVQSSGYGRQIMKESLQALAPYKRPPHLVGPPKATLQASPPARRFYQQLGYSLGAISERELPNGEWFPHTYYFMNLHESG